MRGFVDWLKGIIANYLGPVLFAAVIVLAWWAYNDIKQLEKQTDTLIKAVSGQCQQILIGQGYTIVPPQEEK